MDFSKKYLPTDVSTFSTMIAGNYVYVDKTQWIYNLFTSGSRYYFLSRPRRFGKSLLVSTLKEFFTGNKQLFKDLWIYTSDYTWQYHPVIYLDFASIAHSNPQELLLNLSWTLDTIAKAYTINIQNAPSTQAKLSLLVKLLAEKYGPNSVVILIDEYDKPLLDHLHNLETAEKQREVLRSFYDTLKGLDAHLRAIFITGVTKFSKTSIFSGINNLNDISLDQEAAQLLGYTQEEIKTYFSDYIEDIAQEEKKPIDSMIELMRQWYNGYRFSDQPLNVYNPFSILYFLKKKKLRNYWFESGTPSFLINLLKKDYKLLGNLDEIELSQSSLGTFELTNIPLVTLLFQTGYLTITDYNKQTDKFKLGYPNEEVRESFNRYLVAVLTQTNPPTVETIISQMLHALDTENIDEFGKLLRTAFAHIPYQLHIEKESYFHSLLQLICTLLNLEAQSEISTDKGRADLVVTAKNHIYIFELKLNTTAVRALQQIEQQKYYERYLIKQKPITLVGLAFNYINNKLELEWQTKRLL